MKILVIGSGAREHSLTSKISKSPLAHDIYVAPGNGGIGKQFKTVPIKASDLSELLSFAQENKIDLTVVGPEEPLTLGIVDKFKKVGLKIFGPSAAASRLEGSKIFTRQLLSKIGVPQPDYKIFETYAEAEKYISSNTTIFPLVIKADGLAAGKGVIIAKDRNEAIEAIKNIMVDKAFGDAGSKILIEEFLAGREVSFFVIANGETAISLPTAQDYKRIGDGDTGPNTGGMGCYSPSAFLSESQKTTILNEIIFPVLQGLKKEGSPYDGFLYAGLMITDRGIKVIEFNCRIGDPEAEVIFPRIKSDIVPYLLATAESRLEEMPEIDAIDEAAVTVIISSNGYPGKPDTGFEIFGIDEAERESDVKVYHAGTVLKDGKIVTSGGRVLAITAIGNNIKSARNRAYVAVSKISFQGMYYRKDIADI
jgi:phosphoribosylamine--glycine ligase